MRCMSEEGTIIKLKKWVIPKSLVVCIKLAGETKTLESLSQSQKAWFPNMKSAVANLVNQCHCQSLTGKSYREPLKMNLKKLHQCDQRRMVCVKDLCLASENSSYAKHKLAKRSK